MTAEKRELLLAVGGVGGGVEVEHELGGVLGERGDIIVLDGPLQSDDVLGPDEMLKAREGRLRRQALLVVGEAITGGTQERVEAERGGVVLIVVATGDLEDALAQLLQARVDNLGLVARVGDQGSKAREEAKAFIELAQKKQATLGRDPGSRKVKISSPQNLPASHKMPTRRTMVHNLQQSGSAAQA